MRAPSARIQKSIRRRADGATFYRAPPASGPLRPEARAVLGRVDEGLDHLGGDEVSTELVELREPEVVAVEVRVRRGVRIASKVAEVLHQHEGAVELVAAERPILRDLAQDEGARLRGVAGRKLRDQRIALCGAQHPPGLGLYGLDEL